MDYLSNALYDEKSINELIEKHFNGFYIHVASMDGLKKLKPHNPSKTSMEMQRKRVCVSKSLTGALKGRYSRKNEELSVYIVPDLNPYKPKEHEVVDVEETRERCYFKEVPCQEIGKIKITRDWKSNINWK